VKILIQLLLMNLKIASRQKATQGFTWQFRKQVDEFGFRPERISGAYIKNAILS